MSQPPQEQISVVPVATISIVDVFAKQVEMSQQLAVITVQLQDLPDHEARLRALERFRFTTLGACIAVSALVSGLGTWAGILLAHH